MKQYSSYTLVTLVSLGFLAGCGDGADPTHEPGINEDPTQDYTTFDVEWREDAVIIDDLAEVQGTLVSADYAAGEFVFDPGFPGLDELEVGRRTLLAGVGIFEVMDKRTADSGVALLVEPRPLTDVIENGTIAWRRSIVSMEADDQVGLGIGENEADTIGKLKQELGAYEEGKLDYSGKIGAFDITFKLEKAASGLKFAASSKLSAANAKANAAVSGNIRGLTNETNIEIDARSVKTFSVKFLGVEGDVTIDAGATELGLINEKFQIPARLSAPVLIGGIPFRIDVGGSMEWSSTLVTNTSAIFNGSTRFYGGVGARVIDGDMTYLSTFETSDVTLGERTHVGTVTAGLGFLMNFPEIGFGIGHPRALDASASFKFKSEVVSNFSLRYGAAGPAPVITGNCTTSSTNFGATISGKVSAIGITLAESEEPLFGKLGDKVKTGNACE